MLTQTVGAVLCHGSRANFDVLEHQSKALALVDKTTLHACFMPALVPQLVGFVQKHPRPCGQHGPHASRWRTSVLMVH